MVILGLGSNLGDRLQSLRNALHEIKSIPGVTVKSVSPVYQSKALLPDGAPLDWDKSYLNVCIQCETSLDPFVFLEKTQSIEKKCGRRPEKKWGPRMIDIDLLAWDHLVLDHEKLVIPHPHLFDRPFALFPLVDITPRWIPPHQKNNAGKTAMEYAELLQLNSSCSISKINQRIDTPQLVGILNITPDSFSDGGKYHCFKSACDRAKQLIEEGAEIIDIGAESTRPHAAPITAETEWNRLQPILEWIMEHRSQFLITPKISIDTYHSEVANKALGLGVDWINDVSGLSQPDMCEILSQQTCDIVLMHHLGIPADRQKILPLNSDPVTLIRRDIENTLKNIEMFHIKKKRIILDVGIGFGKNSYQSLELLQRIECFHDYGLRLLVGHSRKSFLDRFTEQSYEKRDLETIILSLKLAQKSVNYLRVHDVFGHSRSFHVNAMT